MNIETFGMLDLRKAEQLQKDAIALHLSPVPVMLFEAKVFTKNGELKRHIQSKSNSWVRNAYNIMPIGIGSFNNTGTTYAGGSSALKNPAGTVRGAGAIMTYQGNMGPSCELVAGYGNTAESLDDYTLTSEFATGSAVNQLTKGSTSNQVTWVSASHKLVRDVLRYFINNYSAAQEIKEIGLKELTTYAGSGSSPTSEYMLMVRDVLESVITVEPAEAILFHYRIETLFPS